MSEFWIDIPYRDPDQPIFDEHEDDVLGDLRRALDPGQDRDVSRQVLLDAMLTDGTQTVGELCAQMADPEQARQLGDRARQNLNLRTFSEIEARVKLNRALRWPPPPPTPPRRDEGGKAIMECAAEGCGTLSRNHAGDIAAINVNKFWCGEHEHLAAEGDLDAFVQEIRFAEGGGFEMRPEAAEHYRRVYAEAEEKGRVEDERKQEEATRLRRLEEEYLERVAAEDEPVLGVPQNPRLWRVE